MAMSYKERWDLAREMIRHEDGLVNNRVTRLLVLQAFLFGAFVNGLGLYGKLPMRAQGLFVTLGLMANCEEQLTEVPPLASLKENGNMQRRTLGHSTLEVSALGLGCMGLSYGYGP